jgi:hypothetical protein
MEKEQDTSHRIFAQPWITGKQLPIILWNYTAFGTIFFAKMKNTQNIHNVVFN